MALLAPLAMAWPAAGATVPGELLFVDPGVQDSARLLQGLRPGVEGRRLAPAEASLEGIAARVAGRTGLQALHVVAHGEPGRLLLGRDPLTAATLPRHAAALAALGRSLAPGGSLQVHGCEVAAGGEGEAFLKALGRLAGVPVAAAAAPLGQGRTWELDRQVGAAARPSPFTAAFQAAYGGRLGTVATPVTLDFNSAAAFSPAPLSGFFGTTDNYLTTYSQSGMTWTLQNVLPGDYLSGAGSFQGMIAPCDSTAYNGGFSGATVTTTLAASATFELKALDLRWTGVASTPDSTLQILGYLGATQVADTGVFDSGASKQNLFQTLNQAGVLSSFVGVTLDRIVIRCRDWFDVDNLQVVANLPTPCANVSSITRQDSAVTAASSVSYLVTFDRAVTGLTASNFDLNPTLTGAAITDVSAKAGTSNAQWVITLNPGTADGTLILRLVNDTGLSTTVCDTLPKAGPAYVIDRTAPAVALGSPSPSSTSTGPVTCTVSYLDANFASCTLSASDITLVATGTAACGSIGVSGSGSTRTVTLGSLSGNGTLGIRVAAGTGTDAAGNTNALSATSATFTVINKLTSTTALVSSVNPTTYGQSVTLTATVTSGATGTVTFMDGASTLGTATLDGSSTASLATSALGGGSHSLTAVYGGDSAYNGSTSSALTQVINPAAPGLALAASPNPSTYGQSVTLTATLSAGVTGTVTFKDGSTTLGTASPNGSGVATLATSTLGGGSHTLSAVYGGDANYSSATATTSLVVQTAATTTSLVGTPNPSTFGQSLTLTAIVTSGATGTVTFKDGATTLGTASLIGGTASFSTSALGGGTHTLTAAYPGDANFAASVSSPVTQVVQPAATTTVLNPTPNPCTYGQAVTLTASVASGDTGTVTFLDGGVTLGSAPLSGGTGTLVTSALGGGTHLLTAVYSGSANHGGSTSAQSTLTVNKASFTLPILVGPDPSTYGQTVTVSVSVPADATGTITFRDGGTTVASVPINAGAAFIQTTTLPVGSHSFTAVYSGDANYASVTSGSVTQVVDTAASATSLAATPNPAVYGQTVILTATVSSLATGTVTFKDGATTLGTATLSGGSATFATSALAIGPHTLTAVYGGNANFTGSTSASLALTVGTLPTTTTLAASPNPSTFGAAVTFTATVTSGATGTVTFQDGSTTLGTATLSGGTAALTVSTLAGGSHAISAVYGGAATYAPSTASTVTLVVQAAPVIPVLVASPNPATYGQPLTLTATLPIGATGTVTFKEGATTLGTATVGGGLAAFSPAALGGGSHALTAVYGGDANYAPGTSAPLTLPVAPAASTVTLAVSAQPATYGQDVTFTATLTAGATGTVTFKDGTTTLGAIPANGGSAAFTTRGLRGGDHAIHAEYSGDANFAASTSAATVLTVVPVLPGAPAILSAAAGDGQATVAFTAPDSDGGTAVTAYTVTALVDGAPTLLAARGAASPLTVQGLVNHRAYTFTVTATTGAGDGPASAPSAYAMPGPASKVLLLHDALQGPAGLAAALASRAALGANLAVTAWDTASAAPPALAAFDQVWDLRAASALGAGDAALFQAYVRGGGVLALLGGLGSPRNDGIAALASDLGGGTIRTADGDGAVQALVAPFTGPAGLTSLAFPGSGVFTAWGTGAPVSLDPSGRATGVAWVPGTLALAPKGALLAVLATDPFGPAAAAPADAFVCDLLNHQARLATAAPRILSLGVAAQLNTVTYTVGTSAPVTVSGAPFLPVTVGGAPARAAYVSGSGTTSLVFRYVASPGDNGAAAAGPALRVADATAAVGALRDADGFPARTDLEGLATGTPVIDTAAPAAPVITSVAGRTVTGTAEAGATVRVYLGATLLGTAQADAAGAWTFTLPVNQSGSLTATAADGYGNVSGGSAATTVDTLLPAPQGQDVTVTAGSVAQPITPVIGGGKATALTIAEAPAHGDLTASGLRFLYTPAAGFWGHDRFTYTATNANGTSAAAEVRIFVQAATPPVIALDAPADGMTTSAVLLTVEGSATSVNGAVTLTLDGAPATVLPSGRFSVPVRLKAGANVLTLTATDVAGLTAQAVRKVTLDLTAPRLEVVAPANGAVVQVPDLTLAGSASAAPGTEGLDSLAGVTWRLNGGAAAPAPLVNGAFAVPVTLATGANTLVVEATSLAGKTARETRTITFGSGVAVAVTDPERDLLLLPDAYLLRGTVASDAPPVTVTVTLGGRTWTPAVQNGAFSVRLPLDGYQDWCAVVSATDALGRRADTARHLVRAAATTPALYTMADALRAFQIANGLVTPTAEDLARFDLAPWANGVSRPDGVIDLQDAVLVLWAASGHSLLP